MIVRNVTRIFVGLALAGLFSWLIFQQLSIDELKASFRAVDWLLLITSATLFFLGYSCRIERWRLMLLRDNPALKWKNCAGPLMASVAANNVLPFRAGDLLRGFGFNAQLQIRTSTSLTALWVERLLDLLMVFSFLGLTLIIFGINTTHLVGVGGALLTAMACCFLVVLLFPQIFRPPVMLVVRHLIRVSPVIGNKVQFGVDNAFSALADASKAKIIVKLLFWSLVAWTAEGMVFWLLALALPSVTNHYAAWLALPVGTLATIVPSTPGYIGTFDYFTAQAMIALGNSASASIAYSLLVHAVLWLPPTVVGGIYLIFTSIKKRYKPEAV